MPHGLTDIELQKVTELFSANPRIERAILYGSRAKGTHRPFSDVDITLVGEDLSRSDLNKLLLAIDDLLLPYSFDISLFHTLKNEDLIEHINRVGIEIYRKNIEWKEYKLGEICYFETTKISALSISLEEYISTENMIADKGGVVLASKKPEDGVVTRYKEGNILISNIRPYFKKIWKATNDGGCSNDVLCLVENKDLVINVFLYYLLSQDAFFDYVMLGSKGCKMPRGDKAHIMNFPVLLPPLPEQKRIAEILSSLNDKIDLLTRENATLEAMAETIFRKWFIEEAKEDWKEGKISDFAEHSKKSLNPKQQPQIQFYHYSIPAFDDKKKPTLDLGSSIQSNKYVIPENCILFSKLNPHKDKRLWLIHSVQENSVCSTEFQIVKPKNDMYLYFLYGWLNYKENYDEIASGVGGTSSSHQRIDPKSIFDFPCPEIEQEMIKNYNSVSKPMYLKIEKNRIQIWNLMQMRDGLLPKLMNGEI